MFDKKSVVGRINLTNNLKREFKIIEADKETGKIVGEYTENWKYFDRIFEDIVKEMENKNSVFTFYKFSPDNLKKTIDNIVEIKEQDKDTIENYYRNEYLQKNKDEIYKPIFQLNKEKLSNAKGFVENFLEIKDIIKKMSKIDKFSFEINVNKENDKIQFKVIQYDKKEKVNEYRADNYIDFKEKIVTDFFKKIVNIQNEEKDLKKYLNNEYCEELIKKSFPIEIEQDFKFSYRETKINQYDGKVFFNVDLGKNKYFESGYNNIINTFSLIITNKDYFNTYTDEREKNGTIYSKIENIKKDNEKLYKHIKTLYDKETWQDIINDVKVNSTIEVNYYGSARQETIKECLNNFDFEFDKRILQRNNLNEFLEDRVLKKDVDLAKELTLIYSDVEDKNYIKEFLNTDNINLCVDIDNYSENVKKYMSAKISEAKINLLNELEKVTDSISFQNLQIEYANKETGTIRKEKDFTKNQFIIFLSENNPDFKAMEQFGTKKALLSNSKLRKGFQKEMFKKYNIPVYQKEINTIIGKINPKKYDFLIESRFNKYFGKIKIEKRKEITKEKEKTIEL